MCCRRRLGQALRTFFELLPEAQSAGVALPAELANLDQARRLRQPTDPNPPPAVRRRQHRTHAHGFTWFPRRSLPQLKVLLDTLPDYIPDEQQPSYVMAIPCRPVLVALAQLLSGVPQGLQGMQHVNWESLKQHP